MKPERVMRNAIKIRKQVREKGEAKLRKWDMFGDSYYYDPSVVPNNYDSLRPVFGKGNVGIRSKVRGCNTSVKSYIRKDPKLKKRLVEHLKKDELGTFEYSKCSALTNPMLFARKEAKLADAGYFGEGVVRFRNLLKNNQDIARSNGFNDEYGRRRTREFDAKRMAEMRDRIIARELKEITNKKGSKFKSKNNLAMLFKKR